MSKTVKYLYPSLYVLSIVLANVLIGIFGVIPIGFGLYAPAGVLLAGFCFWFRDEVQEYHGVKHTIIYIMIACVISYAISDQNVAVASAIAFIASELQDTLIYSKLRNKNRLLAILLSNTVGSVVDSVLFLYIAFGNIDYVMGQIVGKSYTTIASMLIVIVSSKVHHAFLSKQK